MFQYVAITPWKRSRSFAPGSNFGTTSLNARSIFCARHHERREGYISPSKIQVEISVAQVVGLLRGILSCDHDRERFPIIDKSANGFHELCRRGVVFDMHDYSNF